MSIRRKLKENANDSKNTRMDILQSLRISDWRVDILAHLSRYGKIAELAIEEAKRIGRPLRTLDIGCGEMYPLRVLYRAHVIRKSDIVASCTGVDLDEASFAWAAELSSMVKNLNITFRVQDLTTNPRFPFSDGELDFVWCTEVIEHMRPEFVPPWLDDVDRCLRAGGLLFFSTPNHDGSNEKLPADHVYEWGFRELKNEFEKRWKISTMTGTFIQLPKFKSANRVRKRMPDQLVRIFESRFDSFWLRNVLAGPFPEVSNNVAWVMRKPVAGEIGR